MVERVLSMHEAQGSIPCSSTFFGFFFVELKAKLELELELELELQF
jgi:hypothetical protein